MAKIIDGGPAYPVKTIHIQNKNGKTDSHTVYLTGMSLRDHFAGMAMQAIIGKHGVMSYKNVAEMESEARDIWEAGPDVEALDMSHAGTAFVAYEIADAMIAARNVQDPDDLPVS